jgi:hypothetical protein
LGRHPEVQQIANTTFQDRHPNIPPLAFKPQRRTIQPPTTQAAYGKLLADNGCCTNIRGHRTNIQGRRPVLEVKQPILSHVDRVDNLAALATKDCYQRHASNKITL